MRNEDLPEIVIKRLLATPRDERLAVLRHSLNVPSAADYPGGRVALLASLRATLRSQLVHAPALRRARIANTLLAVQMEMNR